MAGEPTKKASAKKSAVCPASGCELPVGSLLTQVSRFQEWAAQNPPESRGGEWECDYPDLHLLRLAALEFVASKSFADWSAEELQAVLYALARDNECERIAEEIPSLNVETLLALTRASIAIGERDAKWQLAVQLGRLEMDVAEAEQLLVTLARDEDEYVRRMSLEALAQRGSLATEELALEAWHRPDGIEHSRMMALWCLHRVGSPRLEQFLAEAERDERKHLAECARRIRQGAIDP